jgi:hypothetical protein
MAPEVHQCTISHFLQVGPELVNTTALVILYHQQHFRIG